MSIIQLKNYRCNYEYLNHNQDQTILFSNSLGTDYSMWNLVIDYLKSDFNIILHDTRGHGKSSNTSYELKISELAEDSIELLDILGIQTKVIFCGLSMGGLIGQHLAIYHAERFNHIILANTASKIGTIENWNSRIDTVRTKGLESILAGTSDRWFTPDFIQNKAAIVQGILNQFAANDLQGYCANCAAVRDADYRYLIQKIDIPVLIIAGKYDVVTTVGDAESMQSQIPNSKLSILEANHLSAVECSQDFAALILSLSNK